MNTPSGEQVHTIGEFIMPHCEHSETTVEIKPFYQHPHHRADLKVDHHPKNAFAKHFLNTVNISMVLGVLMASTRFLRGEGLNWEQSLKKLEVLVIVQMASTAKRKTNAADRFL